MENVMFNISRTAAIISLLLPASVLAQTIEGDIKSQQNKPVANATIRIEGSNTVITADENGHFTLNNMPEGEVELHIIAPGFAHLHQHIFVSDNTNNALSFVLTRSPIEVIDVVATPIHMSVMESASPVNVLSGDALRRQQAASLGDSLEKLPGVQSNFHGNVASTPIIRGLSGPRVMISQNGLDVSDVSRVGPDHSVSSDASTSQQIEVLRGPATLFYGSGAVGGVINVVDGRVPSDSTTRGEWLIEQNSVDDRKLGSFNFTTGTESFGFYADGHWRKSNDYEVPVEAELADDESDEHEHDHGDETYTVENSAEDSKGFTLGGSYLFNQGYIGVALEKFNREYGIPGHSHGTGDDAESVYADLSQTRVQVLGEVNLKHDWIKQIKLASGFTDYEHQEIEAGVTGTLFENQTQELKIDIIHNLISGWNGGISLHIKNSDVAAKGEEAFTPPNETQTFALAFMEEKHFGDVLLQFGARVEHVSLNADNVLLPNLAAHEHDEANDHDHGHEHEETNVTRVFTVEQDFTPVSLSAGLVWDFAKEYNLGLSLSRSQRAPSASELLSFGPHIGTGTYEVGALFSLTDDGIGLSNNETDLETANNIDITLRKTQGDIGYVLNAFYNQVDNYYYQNFTELYVESGHDHGEDTSSHDEHNNELPVYLFQTNDVVLYGFEAQIAWQVTDTFKTSVFSDYVNAQLKDGGDLPHTPPLRFGMQFSYENEIISAHLDITRYQDQNNIAENETATNGYTLIGATVSYDLQVLNQDLSLYLKGTNLTNTEARVHTSFIKDIAPRPARSIAVGVTGYF